MRSKLKNIAFLLIVTFLAAMLPTKIMAEEQPGIPADSQANLKTASVVKELKDKREENMKYFLMDDGTYQAVVYNEPVHYLEDGQWKDIDNTLVDSKADSDIDDAEEQTNNFIDNINGKTNLDSPVESVKDEKGGYLENTNNDVKFKIAKNINDKKLVSIKKDKYQISWNVKVSGSSNGQVINKNIDDEIDKIEKNDKASDKNTKKNNLKKVVAQKNESQIDFNGISDGVDLQYLIKGKTLRENIVINKEASANSFTFNLSVKNLTAVKKDNTIEFLDKKTQNEVFSIVPPVMYDANGESSEDIQIDVKENKKGYTLILTPNKAWMNSTDRKYPIVIDPDVTSTLSQKDIDDTFICSNDTENKKYNLFLRVGNVPTIGTTETYLKFNNLPKLNTGDMVTNCQLYLDKQSSYSGSDGEIEAHKILTDWNNDSISWSNKPGVESKITDTQKVSGDWYSWDITNIAKAWYNNESNYGVMLKRSNPASGHTAFLSSDTSSAYSGGWPRVVVSYTNNSGLEDYWTYHSQGAGRAGTGYINDYNGNLIFEHDDMDTTGNRMPISVKHIYNSNDRNSSSGYGNGWKTNFNQKIVNQSIGGTQYYVYIDEDGTKHYFYYDSTSKTYKNEEGLDLTFKINSDSTYDIIDKNGTDMYFMWSGLIRKITDKNGNTDTITYNGAVLYQVTDGAGRVTSFTATAQGYLTGITDPDGRKTQFIYTGTDLTNIIYPDGNKTTYTYDSNHNLISAANYDGLKLTYSYYTVAPYRVKQVTQTGADGTGGGSLSISYGFNDTSFTDAKNRTEIYQFNNSGNTMCITDGDGNAQAYQYTTDNAKSTNKLSLDSKLQKSNKNYLKNSSAEVSNSYWTFGYTGASAVGSGSYSNEAAYIGSNSLKIAKTDYGNTVYYNQNVDLTKGKTYTFSGYVKTNGITSDENFGATIYVFYQDKNGELQSVHLKYITGTTDWERYSVTFTLPADAASTTVSVRAGVVLEKGTAYFDALQLEEGTLESRYNLLENSDFDYGSLSSENWLYNMGDSTGGVTTLENRSIYKIQGNLGKSKNISQVVNVSGKAGDSFVLSGWAKADSLPKDSSANRYFALDLGINLNDGTTQWVVINFNADSGKWQFASGPAVAKGDYKSLTYFVPYFLMNFQRIMP